MRKIKFKKDRKAQPNQLEYTGRHKKMESEMQLFVYDTADFLEYEDVDIIDLKSCINDQKTNWLNLHGLNELEIIEAIGLFSRLIILCSDILNTTREQS
jgi:magnesium transporter